MLEKHSSGTSMWAWRTALGVVPTNTFEKDVKACAEALDAAREAGIRAGLGAGAAYLREAAAKFDSASITGMTFVRIYEDLAQGIDHIEPKKL